MLFFCCFVVVLLLFCCCFVVVLLFFLLFCCFFFVFFLLFCCFFLLLEFWKCTLQSANPWRSGFICSQDDVMFLFLNMEASTVHSRHPDYFCFFVLFCFYTWFLKGTDPQARVFLLLFFFFFFFFLFWLVCLLINTPRTQKSDSVIPHRHAFADNRQEY